MTVHFWNVWMVHKFNFERTQYRKICYVRRHFPTAKIHKIEYINSFSNIQVGMWCQSVNVYCDNEWINTIYFQWQRKHRMARLQWLIELVLKIKHAPKWWNFFQQKPFLLKLISSLSLFSLSLPTSNPSSLYLLILLDNRKRVRIIKVM